MSAGSENPIKSQAEDTLERSDAAKHLADELRSLDASEGSVVALLGPWGSGKTSFINLVREHLAATSEVPVLDFNPWMFSGAEQLVDSFFVEIAAQLRLKDGKLGKIADEIDKYGELLSPLSVIPFVGGWIERFGKAGKSLKNFQDRRKQSVSVRRKELAAELAKLEVPIVVVIDDIDRLATAEIRDIFKLVRLTASFPNVIYLLAFDRKRVEQALSESGIEGRNFLEKIVQLPVNLPAVPQRTLLRQLVTEVNAALDELGEIEPFDQGRWHDLLAEIVFPLLHNVRDVKRYAASVRGTVRALKGHIDLGDLLTLDAVRVFLPDTLAAIERAQVALTSPESSFGDRDYMRDQHKQAVQAVVESAGNDRSVAEAMVQRVFPAAGRHIGKPIYGSEWSAKWLRARRVAHTDVLSLYLERVVNAGLAAFADGERAYSLLGNEDELDRFLRSISPERQEDVITALEEWEGEYPVEAVLPATIVLLNLLPVLPEREQHTLYTTDPRLSIVRVVLRLLRALPSVRAVEQLVVDSWTKIRTIESRAELVRMVGHREDEGHGLVSEEAASTYEERLKHDLYESSTDDLLAGRDIVHTLLVLSRLSDVTVADLDVLNDPRVVKAILLGSYTETRGQSMGSRAIYKTPRLYWDTLVSFFGSEERLFAAIDEMKSALGADKNLENVLALVVKYRSGWRPKEFGNNE